MTTTRILGIDPGSRKTGFGIIQQSGQQMLYVVSGIIRTTEGMLADRLQQVFEGICQLVDIYRPTEAAIEEIFMHRNAASALKLGQARGAAIVAMKIKGLSVAEYTARQVKQAVVGYGNADKSQIQMMVKQLLSLDNVPAEDAADGLAIAMCHRQACSGLLAEARAGGYRRGRILR